MDLSDLPRPYRGSGQRLEAADAQTLVSQLGSEVASHLSQALERVTALTATGRIDRDGLRALRDEIDAARRAGIIGQQIVRLASGRVQMGTERVDVAALLREALRQRGREITARAIDLRQSFPSADAPAAVTSDATLVFALLQTLLDWTFQHAAGPVELALDTAHLPLLLRIAVRYAYHDGADDTPAATAAGFVHEASLDTMTWRLLLQTAAVLGVRADRRDGGGRTELTLEFAADAPAASSADGAPAGGDGDNSQPLAGRHVMVLAARRDVRNAVRDALRPMGVLIDFVATIDETRALALEGLPHALVYEASLAGSAFGRLRDEWLAEVSDVGFIEIAEDGRALQLAAGPRSHASVARDAIAQALPTALWFELSRHAAAPAPLPPPRPHA